MAVLNNNFIEFSGHNSVVQKVVLDMLRKEDAIIGNLTDYHVNWLLKFTYTWFSTRRVAMAFDFHSSPRRIYITPRTAAGGLFSTVDWLKHKARMFKNRTERDLPTYLGMNEFEIKFCRRPHTGVDIGDIHDDAGPEGDNSGTPVQA